MSWAGRSVNLQQKINRCSHLLYGRAPGNKDEHEKVDTMHDLNIFEWFPLRVYIRWNYRQRHRFSKRCLLAKSHRTFFASAANVWVKIWSRTVSRSAEVASSKDPRASIRAMPSRTPLYSWSWHPSFCLIYIPRQMIHPFRRKRNVDGTYLLFAFAFLDKPRAREFLGFWSAHGSVTQVFDRSTDSHVCFMMVARGLDFLCNFADGAFTQHAGLIGEKVLPGFWTYPWYLSRAWIKTRAPIKISGENPCFDE